MRTQAHRIVDTDPKRGNVVVRVTGTRHDEPTYQVRQSLPNTQEVPGHDHHTNRVRETGSGSHGPILRSVPTNRLSQHLDRSSGSRQWLRRRRRRWSRPFGTKQWRATWPRWSRSRPHARGGRGPPCPGEVALGSRRGRAACTYWRSASACVGPRSSGSVGRHRLRARAAVGAPRYHQPLSSGQLVRRRPFGPHRSHRGHLLEGVCRAADAWAGDPSHARAPSPILVMPRVHALT
jgi:hypothetical protein